MYSIVLKYIYICIVNNLRMDIENSKAQMKKGVLELCILSIISKNDAYASDIIEYMRNADLLIVEGTLYPLLTRLKNDGLLTYRWEESKSGPPRKYYTITPLGRDFLHELQGSWNELLASVSIVLQNK